ncbi:unnamed protein product [Gulo gulo]|uniref:Uncharacterized protein n=1 Tax=Gulo gulo TaxID=48420 RepID=A0A9X9LEE8_GULGU|nr:unnamed protein product [Gulo gulo]
MHQLLDTDTSIPLVFLLLSSRHTYSIIPKNTNNLRTYLEIGYNAHSNTSHQSKN